MPVPSYPREHFRKREAPDYVGPSLAQLAWVGRMTAKVDRWRAA